MAHLGFLKGRRIIPALVLTLGLSGAAVAQEAEAPARAPAQPPTPASPWVKLCNTDTATKRELCVVMQELRAETGQFIASATIRQITGEPKLSLIAAVPLGMQLKPGLRAQVDEGQQQEIKYDICFPNACYGEIEVNADFIASLKGGKQILITTLTQQGKPARFPLTLAGFTKAFDSKGLDAVAAQAKQEDLNKALQARAEEARKKLIEQQQKEAGGGTAAN